MIRLRAICRLDHDGQRLVVGDEFDAREGDAAIFVRRGQAAVVVSAVVEPVIVVPAVVVEPDPGD